MKQLQVRISGAGSVRFDRLKAEKLEVNVAGIGSGASRRLGRRAAPGAHLGPRRLSRREPREPVATLSVSGAGDVKVWATKELTASVSGVANVDFWGSATVTRSNSGITTWNDRGDKRAAP